MEQKNTMEVVQETTPQKQALFGEEFAYAAITAIMLTTYAAINLSLFIV